MVAVESESETEQQQTQEFANKGVIIVKDEEEEALKAMREKLRKQFGIGAGAKKNETAAGEEEEEGDEGEEEDEHLPEEEKNFDHVLNDEYADDQIGDLEGEVE